MATIRRIEIKRFRGILALDWYPGPGVNCLLGPGDSGKSTILDAIDYCLCARRSIALADTDFFKLEASEGFRVALTLGDLPDPLLNLDAYADYLRGFDSKKVKVEDEPGKGLETVITLQLVVSPDLEPTWSLYSDRTRDNESPRMLPWSHRTLLSPARLGTQPGFHLSWSRGSLLNRLSDDVLRSNAHLQEAAREARQKFGDSAADQLKETLKLVKETAAGLGVPVGAGVTALLDAHSVSFGEGSVALHTEDGVPLRSLGTGSSRLLVAGLQREANAESSVLLVDEVEYGLEPHRLTRLLHSLGSKEEAPRVQVFMTTHSPVALRELSGSQLAVLRQIDSTHYALPVSTNDEIQGAVRLFPEAFLAQKVIVCEGASEVGLIRGLDIYWSSNGALSLQALAVAYVDSGGSEPDRCFKRGLPFQALGYQVAVLQDSDKPPTAALVEEFEDNGGLFVHWSEERALEDEIFACAPDPAVTALLNLARDLVGSELVDSHIQNESSGKTKLTDVAAEGATGGYSRVTRDLLGKASRRKSSGWYKSISAMERVASEIIAPSFDGFDKAFSSRVEKLFEWARRDA